MRVFALGYDVPQQAALDEMLVRIFGVPSRIIPPDQGEATLEEVLSGRAQACGPLLEPARLVLFDDFGDLEINRFILEYSRATLPEPILAAVTEVNRRWTLRRLLEALSEEHRQAAEAGFGLAEPG